MIACDVARAVLVGALAVAAAVAAPLWTLMALLLAAELFSAPFDTARAAVLPDVLPDPEDYLTGSGLCRVLNQVNQVVGLAAGGAVVYLSFTGVRAGGAGRGRTDLRGLRPAARGGPAPAAAGRR